MSNNQRERESHIHDRTTRKKVMRCLRWDIKGVIQHGVLK